MCLCACSKCKFVFLLRVKTYEVDKFPKWWIRGLQRGLLGPQSGLLGSQSGLFGPQSGLLGPQSGLLGPQSGPSSP